jgi:hypothetical protein
MGADVVVYYITGKQIGPLSVPKSWCEECDLTVRGVQQALAETDPQGRLDFVAKPWLRHAIPALLRGGWHPPVVLIEGEVFSQGVVPDAATLRRRLTAAVESKLLADTRQARQ